MAIKRKVGILILFIAVVGATVVYAEEEAASVNLTVGRSTIIEVGTPISRVSLTSADVADALVTSPAQLLVHGKTPGTISMFVWDRAGAIRRYDVSVQRDLSRLASQMSELFPGERISVQGNGRSVIVSGKASSKYIADKAVEVAAGYVEKKEEVVNLLQVQTGGANQVLLHVRFAEVSRSALTELGAAWFTSPIGVKNTLSRITAGTPGPTFEDLEWTKESSDFGADVTSAKGKFAFSDFLNLFVFSQKYDLGAVVRLLQTRGLFQSLAEPNLVTESGKEASFLAGGEIPVPVAQGTGGNLSIAIQWKEFGIRLNFTPTVNNERVSLKVRPEVSSLDFNNAILLNGFRIPALSTRRAETEVELQNRQTFAIAGLLNNTATQTLQKVPGIGDIPILGLLFRSKAAQKNMTELVVMITPEILPPTSPGVTSQLPRLTEPYLGLPPANRQLPQPPPAFQQPAPGGATNIVPQTGAPAAAATSAPGATPVAAAPAVPAPVVAAPAAPTAVPLSPRTKEEQRALEREQREDRQRAIEQQKRDMKAAEEQRRRDAKAAREREEKERVERERQERAAREQAKRDAEQAKRDAEAARRQAEIDREHQRQIDEAAAKLKAAEQAYQAELEKRQKAEQPK